MSSSDRVIGILGLFSLERRVWTAEAIAAHFGVSTSQAYRYCKSLVTAGFLDPLLPAGYTLGPAILELERLVQMSDPLISAARPAMLGLVPLAPSGATIVISKLYRSRVIGMDQVMSYGPQAVISFRRGQSMPLLWGATSKVILAYMKSRDLSRVYSAQAALAPSRAKPTPSLAALKKELAAIREAGHCLAHGEVDPGRFAIAAPILTAQGAAMGSLTMAIPEKAAGQRSVRMLAANIVAAAKQIEHRMAEQLAIEAQKNQYCLAREPQRQGKA